MPSKAKKSPFFVEPLIQLTAPRQELGACSQVVMVDALADDISDV